MSTLIENVAKVKTAHENLKTAIAAKGVEVPSGTKLSDMPALVDEIQTGEGGTPQEVEWGSVYADSPEESIDVPKAIYLNVDFTTATNLYGCFENCKSLTSLTFPYGFGQNATDLARCFKFC